MLRSTIENEHRGRVARRGRLKRLSWISIGVLGTLCGGVLTAASADRVRHTLLSAAADAAAKPPAAASTKEVKIGNFAFTPAVLTVAAGTKVTWINHDEEPHTVVATKKEFRSPALDTDERFSHTFAKPGTYLYYCSVHPQMTGKVIVR